MSIKGNSLRILTYLYIILPALVFLVGFSSLPWAILFGGIVIAALGLCLFQDKEDYPDLPVNFSLLAVILFILLIVSISGIAGIAFQNTDIPYRNRMFLTLIEEKWPAVKQVVFEGETQVRGFIYYIGFWLVPALVGKVCGVVVGYVALGLWASLGVFLTWFHIGRYLGQFKSWHLLLFFLFGGLDIVGWSIQGYSMFFSDIHLEWWSPYQYSSFTTQLFWVYNQAIYGWILTLLILKNKSSKNLVFIWSVGLLCCTLPFVGMLPYLLYQIICNLKDSSKSAKQRWKELFSFQNVFGGGVIGIISFLYLMGNLSAGNIQRKAEQALSFDTIYIYLLFIFLEGLLYLLLIWNKKQRGLYYLTAACLILCPLIRVGGGQDFCMRASIPALLVLFLMVAETLQNKEYICGKLQKYALILVLVLGMQSSLHEIARSVTYTPMMWEGYGIFCPFYVEQDVIFTGANFSGNTEDNLYFRLFAKR